MPRGVRLTEDEQAAKEKKQGAKDLLKEFFAEQFPRAGFPKKGGVTVRTDRGKELLGQIEGARQEGLLDKDNVVARVLSNIQSGAFPPEIMAQFGYPADMSEAEKTERGRKMWAAYKEGGVEGLDKFFTGQEYVAPPEDEFEGVDFDRPALLREQDRIRQTLSPQDATRAIRSEYGFKEPPKYVDVETGEADPYRATMVTGVTEPVGGEKVTAKKLVTSKTGKPVASEESFEGSETRFKPEFREVKESTEPTTLSLNSLYLFRTKEALKSYIQLKNIDTNKYVVVPIPNHLRDNRYLKSVNFNISNPNFRYMMVLKDFVGLTDSAKPVLKVKELKQNEDAKKNNDSHSEKKNPEFVKKYGKMNTKGGMKEFLAEKYEDGEIPEDYEKTPEYTQAQKELESKKEPKPKQASFSSLIELPVTKSTGSKDKNSKKNDKVAEVMREFKEGELHSGKNGPKVTDKDQAMAIALAQAGKSKKKTSEKGNIIEKLADSTFNPVASDLVDSGKEGLATIIELTVDNDKKPEAKTKSKESLSDACWEGYEAIGFKKKNGKKVPNCVPKAKTKSKESLSDACWEGYEAIGMKTKDGRKVPNCVPKSKSKK